MTNRLDGFVIVLAQEIRDDDAQNIINAITMIKGVREVMPIESTFEGHVAARRERLDLLGELQQWIQEQYIE